MSSKKLFYLFLAVMLLSLGLRADAQQPTKVPRIGFLGATSPSVELARMEAFRQGLRELGYEEGKNIVIEWRYAEGKLDRLSELAAELVFSFSETYLLARPCVMLTAWLENRLVPN